ncbi:chromosome segregation protein SMC [Brockia lithotrophica]|uniref:Chromosome partition protein Smc n=1 Tax=Brockia lithotrophica TaxID=933949 RepID=A0A660KVY8_9BACL|nr:chromosome segregation protein SMC [Brockia lithotrophica]RKQ83619.1 condensin subunit Smc [Brockia lithotrophica]
MRLRELWLYGFKSFGRKTGVRFAPGITAIVGPNGSGKSNLIDAVRFVLGEANARALRGSRLEDLVFSGSAARRGLGYAEVTLVLDNRDGFFSLPYEEISVTRRILRNGESAAWINGSPVRLKDLSTLFLDTGLGQGAFAIVGQGEVDALIAERPEARRTAFEELAGIRRFRERKREAEADLAEVEANLTRVRDLLTALEEERAPLREEAERARRYLALREELAEVEGRLLLTELLRHEREAARAFRLAQALEAAEERVREQGTRLAQRLSRLRDAEERLRAGKRREEGEYESLRARREAVLRDLLALEAADAERRQGLVRMRDELRKALAERRHVRAALVRAKAERDELAAELATLAREESELSAPFGEDGDPLPELQDRAFAAAREAARLRSELRRLEEELARLDRRRGQLLAEREELTERHDRALRAAERAKAELDGVRAELERVRAELAERRKRREETARALRTAEARLLEAERELERLRARVAALAHQASLAYGEGVRAVLAAREELGGILGTVSSLLDVPEELGLAVDVALGGAWEHLVVESEGDARRAIAFLKERGKGRATFLPLDTLRPRELPPRERDLLARVPGVRGVLAEWVRTEPRYAVVVRHLLGQVVLAETLAAATQAARLLGFRTRVVTPEGDVVHPGGAMTGGAPRPRGRGGRTSFPPEQVLRAAEAELRRAESEHGEILRATEELRAAEETNARAEEELRARLFSLQEEERDRREEVLRAQREAEVLAAELRAADEELALSEATRSDLKRELAEIRAGLVRAEAEETSLAAELAERAREAERRRREREEFHRRQGELRIRRARLEEKSEANARALADLERVAASLRDEIARTWEAYREGKRHVRAQAERVRSYADELVRYDGELEQRKRVLAGYDAALHAVRRRAEEAEERLRRVDAARVELVRRREAHASRAREAELRAEEVRNRLRATLRLPPEAARERYAPLSDDEVPAARERLASLETALAELGSVNTYVLEEEARIERRMEELSASLEDLEAGKRRLTELLRRLEREMEERFREAFARVDAAFREHVAFLFGGGQGYLVLTDPAHPLEGGVEVVLEPPGKRRMPLTLLSGGERAMAALALLFAFLQVREVPFVILDEAEAALDEGNLGRFGELLRRFRERTQLLVITHRKKTMAFADVLYGVVLDDDGTSRILSVSLEDVDEEAEVTLRTSP